MAETPIDLYRSGNANSPRMDNVRAKDVATYTLDEDEASDIINDYGFLEALCRDLKKNLSEGTTPDVIKPSNMSSKELMRQVLQLSLNERLSLVDAITESIRQEFQSRQAQESSGEHPNDAFVNVISVYEPPPAPAAYYSKEGGKESRKE